MQQISLALVGFGNVGQALVRLLISKREILERDFGFTWKITGIATGRQGSAIDPQGIDPQHALECIQNGASLETLSKVPALTSTLEFIRQVPADVLFENSPVNHSSGEPAASHLRDALKRGMHAISANKGPVVHAYAELTALAASHGKRYLFESAVMDGAPIFSLFRGSLPAMQVHGFQGILNSCTNLMIGLMEDGQDFEDTVRYAKSIGITETDPASDIDGWDAAIKVAAICTVVMGIPLKPQQVQREGIRGITPQRIAEAKAAGERWKLVCRADLGADGSLTASVQPQRVSSRSPFYNINGTSSYVQFASDVLPGLGIIESDPGPETTAYGLLADLINAVRGM